MFVDSHCHLDRLDLSPYNGNLSAALRSAHDAGVDTMLCVCISEENKEAVLEVAAANAAVFASVGVHPCDVRAEVTSIDSLLKWAEAPKVVALGETGLDYFHSQDFVGQQRQSFANHLIAGSQSGLPVIVHTRSAQEDTIICMREHANTEVGGVMHCFTESWEMAKQALDLNFYISFSGIVTFKNAVELKEVAKKVPLDRMLIETDSPYLAPVPYRGKPNEPRYVKEVAEYIAQLRGISTTELAAITRDNFFSLFDRAHDTIKAALK